MVQNQNSRIGGFHLTHKCSEKNINFYRDDIKDNSLPFLDCLVSLSKDGNLSTEVYRRPIHTDKYLLFDSHLLEHKLWVIQTLKDWAQKVSSSTEGNQKELTHIKTVLQTCGYPKWTSVKSSKRCNKEPHKAGQKGKKNERM